MITANMTTKLELRLTDKHFSVENGILTLEINVGTYSLTGKTITAAFNPTGFETAPLSSAVVDGNNVVSIPIFASYIQEGVNYIQLYFRWDTTKLETSGVMMWIIDKPIVATEATTEQQDLMSYYIEQLGDAVTGLDGKVDKVTGKQLSTEDYTTIEKTKLGTIEDGAEVNNISDINATDLTDGGETTLHIHDGRYYTETEVNAITGTLSTLTTTEKTSLVGAVNEVDGKINTANSQRTIIGGGAIINGNFDINQRAVSGTVTLSAGQYGHDRFRGGASGCTYTFATSLNVTTLTISAGSLQQEIEGVNLESGTYVLSWSGTSQGKIGAGSLGASGIIGTVTGGTNLVIEFGTGTLSKVKLEKGSVATAYILKSYADELRDCHRYFIDLNDQNNAYQFYGIGQAYLTTAFSIVTYLPVKMRVKPTAIAVISFAGAMGASGQLGVTQQVTDITCDYYNQNSANLVCTTSNITVQYFYKLLNVNSATSKITLDAEL